MRGLSIPIEKSLSLKWKLLATLGAFMLLLFAAFAYLNQRNLQQQYLEQRQTEYQRSQQQLEGLGNQAKSELLALAHLLPSLSGLREAMMDEDTDALERLFIPQWASLQMDTDLALALFVDDAGEVLLEASVLGDRFAYPQTLLQAVERVVESEQPAVIVDCHGHCLMYAIAPILGGGDTVGAMVLGRSLAHLVVPFHQISQLDIAILAPAHAPMDNGRLVAVTRQEQMAPLLEQAASWLESERSTHHVTHQAMGGRHFELRRLQLPGIDAEQAITAIVIADVTEARERIEAARNRNILLGMAGLLVLALLVIAGAHSPLARLRRVASLLPLLAEQQFGTVRRHLESAPPMLLPDELSQLERTTLALADRLEALEGEVRDRNRALASKMRELSIERERYELAAAGANDGLWDWDLQRDEVYYSQRWRAMLGCAGGDLWNGPDEWLGRVHPDDRESLDRDLNAHLEGRSHWFESEHRVLHERDEYRWMLVRGLAVRGADGTAHRIAGSMTDVTEQRRIQEQLRHDALHDALTGLPNRTLFLDRLEQAMLRSQRSPYRFAVLFLDIDDFKTINDSLGHAHGDQVLLQAAGRLRDPLRPGDTVARLGGDEFAILLEGLTTDAEIKQVVERLQQVMAAPVSISAQEVFIRFSIGIATSTTPGQNPADMLRNADTAMYQSKAGNRGGSTFFDDSMHAHAVRRLSLETSMRQALDRGEFELHFQPLVRLADGQPGGFEALARWPRNQQRPVSPADFVPLAEQSGLIIPLGRWVIEEAVAQAARWYHQRGGTRGVLLPVSLNVSGCQLRDAELLPTLDRALRTHGLPGGGIKLELTESAIIENLSHSLEVLGSLRELGVSLCIDDFGTGYSSLSQLRDFPFDVLKIDRSFIAELTDDPSQEAIVRAIVSIASALGKSVVAEGIETRAQALRLIELKCEMGQGFLFAPALPPDEALALFEDDGERFLRVLTG